MWQKNSHLRTLFLKKYGINDYDGAPPARGHFLLWHQITSCPRGASNWCLRGTP